MLVSVIIPTYNRIEFVTKAIDSVVNQDYNDWELIIIDDGSDDQSFEILSEQYQNYANIKILTQTNQGVSSARNLGIKNASLMKRISELESKQKVVGQDSKKLHLSQKVYDKLSIITDKIKTKKNYSLEKSILLGMNSLMHKSDFIEKVSIEIFEDYLDINLIDKSGNKIDKESLSKGEQQLYATSILKSLVEESGINFPIFVDSPLQKFDKEHSENIIRRFYPSISKQVVLFPLMEKELTFDEFKLMEKNITSIHKIINTEGSSKIEKIENSKLLFE